MQSEYNNHFILISGESGAGKTEASKKILQFYAVSCPSTKLLNNVRDRLLLSNPVLEVSEMEMHAAFYILQLCILRKILMFHNQVLHLFFSSFCLVKFPGLRKCQNLEE